MKRPIRLLSALAPASALLLSACITSPEEQEALREAEYREALRLQAMIEAGECSERRMTGQRTRVIYECGEENEAQAAAARESVRRMQNQGAICGGNC